MFQKNRLFPLVVLMIVFSLFCSCSRDEDGNTGKLIVTATGLSSTFSIRPVINFYTQNNVTSESETSLETPQWFDTGKLYYFSASVPDASACVFSRVKGTASSGDITITATCSSSDTAHTLSGTINGIQDGAMVTLLANNGSLLEAESGEFSFEDLFPDNKVYEITVVKHPPNKFCTVYGGSGTATEDIEDIMISCQDATLLIPNDDLTKGDLGGKSGLTFKCRSLANDLNRFFGFYDSCEQIVPFISFNSSDQIADFPEAKDFNSMAPVYALNIFRPYDYRQISETWDGLFSDSFVQSPLFPWFWSGSKQNGTVDSNTCEEWTSSSPSKKGREGVNSNFSASDYQCSNYNNFVCACLPSFLQIGGTISNTSSSVIITITADRASETLTLNNNGNFYSSVQFATDDTYTVAISDESEDSSCQITEGASGTVSEDSKSEIIIECDSAQTFSLGGTVTGLDGDIVLSLNSSAQLETISADGSFTFDTELADGASYSITVISSPSWQTCTITNGSGVISSDVSNITVTCEDNISYLFPSDNAVAANFGGRSAADTICQTTKSTSYSSLTCAGGVRAFLSVSDSDEIRDMPSNYDVGRFDEILYTSDGTTTTKIADDWSDLLDGTIDAALDENWWSGSDYEGADSGFTCSGWTVADGSSASGGNSGATDAFWIDNSGRLCSQSFKLMCLCFQ